MFFRLTTLAIVATLSLALLQTSASARSAGIAGIHLGTEVKSVSPYEARLFADAVDGHWNEHSLFDAGLVASGVRQPVDFHSAAKKYADWREWLLKSLPREQSSVARAESILHFLHSRILLGEYDLHATEIDRAIATGRYNCVSVTLLYNCLARECGFRTSAIELPHHTYSILEKDGERIEVEATCVDWFSSTRHQARQHAMSLVHASIDHRGAGRQVGEVAIVAMIYYNRGVDALHAKRYDDAVRLNLAALRLDDQHAGARDNLRTAINNHSLALCEVGQFEPAIRQLQVGLQLSPEHAPLRSNMVYVYHRWLETLLSANDLRSARMVLIEARLQQPTAAIWPKWSERLDDHSPRN